MDMRKHSLDRKVDDKEFVYNMALLKSGRTQHIYPISMILF